MHAVQRRIDIKAISNEPDFDLETLIPQLETLTQSLIGKRTEAGNEENNELWKLKHTAFLILVSYIDGIQLARKFHRVGSGRRS